jgi:predicted AlkP superfamily pyrophosphatase or phosphodiesterase
MKKMTKLSYIYDALSIVLLLIFGTLVVNWERYPQSGGFIPASAVTKHVIMISIDGMVPDYYTAPERAGLRAPNLAMLKSGGAYAEGVEGVYPSVTYPAHTTLVTGVRPAQHGIVQNRIFEPPTEEQTGAWYWYADALKSETLWTLAKKAGLKTAAVGWPVTALAEIDYLYPEIWVPDDKKINWERAIPYSSPGLIEKAHVASSLDKETSTDGRRTAISEFIISEYKPNLLLIHLIDLDDAHHKFGPRTPGAVAIAAREDGYLGRILEATRKAGIFEQTTFFIVSDHGFMAIDKKFEPNVLLAKERLLMPDANNRSSTWKAAAWPAGGSCAIVLRDSQDKETAAKVASIFKQVAARKDGPLLRVLSRPELDQLGAVPTATLMLEAAQGYSFGEESSGPEVHDSAADYRGTHGYLPTRPEMRSSLIVYGAGARAGAKIRLARMIDIAPTAAALLELRFSKAGGNVRAEFLNAGDGAINKRKMK